MDAVIGTRADVSTEARWLAEHLGVGEGLFRGWERHIITLYYAYPGRGCGVLNRWWRRMQKGKLSQIVRN